jgi:hypothetical protein
VIYVDRFTLTVVDRGFTAALREGNLFFTVDKISCNFYGA